MPTSQVQVVDTEDSDDKSLKTSSPTHDANNANVNANVNVLERHGSTSGSGYALKDDPHGHGDGRDLDLFDGTLDPVYEAKARVLNRAIQEIGMGRYQWYLFVVAGFGWYSDNLWPIVTGLILSPTINEFDYNGPFLKLGQNIGLLVGAFVWGLGCDVWGRRFSFNITLFITAVFATAAGASNSFITLTVLATLWSVGVGGNLPVDSAVFLEFIPGTHQWLLTVLSIWWAFGQLIGSLIAWPLIANFSCPTPASSTPPSPSSCPRSSNQGWRYFLYTTGGLTFLLFLLRFFVFHLYESPKYLMGRGREEEAVWVLGEVARWNGRGGWWEEVKGAERVRGGLRGAEEVVLRRRSSGGLKNFGEKDVVDVDADAEKGRGGRGVRTGAIDGVRRQLDKFSTEHVRALFATRKLAWSTSLLITLWALIGLAFPLYNSFVTYYLATRGADFGDGSVYITYRNQVILSTIGVPGALLAGLLVELPLLGRKGTLCISTILTGVFLFASTTARTSDALLGWNCAYSFVSNIMYGVLYAISPELFATKDRGTGNGLTATANRVFGVMAPIIALYANLTTSVPIWISGALFIVAGFVALLLPYEPRGKTSL